MVVLIKFYGRNASTSLSGSNTYALLKIKYDVHLRSYNFIPLVRGTIVVGFIVLLGLFLAANIEFTMHIPEKFQVRNIF